MIKRLACALLLLSSSNVAGVAAPPPPPPPKLIVAIAVDQLSADLFDAYAPLLTGGLGRLAQGIVYSNGYQGHAATETCPGHSTMLSGLRPTRTRIIANSWIDQSLARADKTVLCAEDERAPLGPNGKFLPSPAHVEVAVLGDLMKRAWPGSRSVAISGKDRAALMMGGKRPDQRWFFDGQRFITDRSDVLVPAVVPVINRLVAAKIAEAQPGLDAPALCQARSAPVTLKGGMVVGSGNFTRSAGDAGGYRASPALDGAVLALSAALLREMKLGQGSSPDILAVEVSATDYVGHSYGPGGQEMCLQMLSLDRDLGDFMTMLDSTGIDYALVLTGDHGSLDVPERLRLRGVADAAWLAESATTDAIGKVVGAQLGLGEDVLLGGNGGDVWVKASLGAGDRARVLSAASATFAANPQVETVFTKAAIAATAVPSGKPSSWSLIERARASFDPVRSGDLYVVLKKNVMPIVTPAKGYVSTHGTPWDYDRRVPVVFWRRPQFPALRSEEVETVDIMPTMAAVLGLPLAPGSVDGKCLPVFANVRCPTE
ncbi:MAG: alkaline phosphatase family protein [Sphingomicrobium sp.]